MITMLLMTTTTLEEWKTKKRHRTRGKNKGENNDDAGGRIIIILGMPMIHFYLRCCIPSILPLNLLVTHSPALSYLVLPELALSQKWDSLSKAKPPLLQSTPLNIIDQQNATSFQIITWPMYVMSGAVASGSIRARCRKTSP